MGERCVGKKLCLHVPPALNRQLHFQQFSLFQNNFNYYLQMGLEQIVSKDERSV